MLTLSTGKRRSLYGKTRADVARKLAQALRDQEQGAPVVDERQTLEAFLVSWLDMVAPTLEASTVQRYKELMTLHVIPAVGKTRLTRLAPQQIQALYASTLEEGLSPTTVHHLHAALHRALEIAVKLGAVGRNVCDHVEAPRIVKTEMRVLARDEARQLLDTAKGTRYEALLTVALATGMRQGELLGLRWRDVDMDAGMLSVTSSLTWHRAEKVWVIKQPKTRRSRRRIALKAPIVETIRAHWRAQLAQRLALGAAWEDNDLVFCTGQGRPLAARNIERIFHTLLERAALPRIRFHDLRHTCATLALKAKVQPKIVSEMLGHASVAVTLDIYSHVLPDMQDDAAAAMAEMLMAR
jgi:integrase